MSQLKFEIFEYGTPFYQEEVRLRSKVLREPLGLKLTEIELAQDVNDTHIGAFDRGLMVGCLIFKPLSSHLVKMRQVAVDPAWQGRGIGEKLVKFAESVCEIRNWNEIVLHARENVVPFYQKLGYQVASEVFYEVSIPHLKMTKSFGRGTHG